MTNRHNGDVEIEIDGGRKLTFRYDANAWVELEEMSGLEMPEIIDRLQAVKRDENGKPVLDERGQTQARVSIKLQRQLMFVGLKKHHPDITLEEAGELLFACAAAMGEALTASLPKNEEALSGDDDEDPSKRRTPPPNAGAGKTSVPAGSE